MVDFVMHFKPWFCSHENLTVSGTRLGSVSPTRINMAITYSWQETPGKQINDSLASNLILESHTHSSGAAQGLNTGVHDAINLGWKLSLTLRGFTLDNFSLLRTYDLERRAAAERLILFDKQISMLMSNKIPAFYAAAEKLDINEALARAFDDAAGFNTGLKISYTPNLVNISSSHDTKLCAVNAGERAPDVQLLTPGTLDRIRLLRCIPNFAKFYVIVFAGNPRATLPELESTFKYLREDPKSFRRTFPDQVVEIMTVAAVGRTDLGVDDAFEEAGRIGPCYFDVNMQAHVRYGVDVKHGAMLVVRPDGHVAMVVPLTIKGAEEVSKYLGTIFKRSFDVTRERARL